MSDKKKQFNQAKRSVDESSFLVNDDSFLLPDMGQYYQNAVDNPYIKMVDEAIRGVQEGDENKASFYIEKPYTTKLGSHDKEGVYFIKARPDVSDSAEEINYFDGDTLYWSVDDMDAGDEETKTRISNSIKQSTEGLQGRFDTIGLRFLGVDAPEIAHFSIDTVNLDEEETTSFVYKDIKDSSPVVYYFERAAKRKDNDVIHFIKMGDQWREFTPFKNYEGEVKEGFTPVKILLKEGESNEQQLAGGMRAKEIVRELIDKAGGEVYVMLDRVSLARSSDTYPTRYGGSVFSQDPLDRLRYFASQLTDYNPYRYAGYNQWGQENHARFLGVPYVKITDHTGTKWINITKYLITEVPEMEVFPDYTGSPLYEANYGFASEVFKLHTYDYKNRMLADAADVLADLLDDRKKIQKEIFGRDFEALKEWTVTIGDSTLFVPPTSIRTVTNTTNERAPLVRAKGSAIKGATKSERLIEMTIYFNDDRGINGYEYEATLPNGEKTTYYMNGLRSLISQFKFTPYLPIENVYINQVLNIDAVTLVNFQISTLPDYPKCIAAVLTVQEFDYRQFMPELPVSLGENDEYRNAFSQTINYEVMRWYYQRAIKTGESLKDIDVNSAEYLEKTYGHRTALIPMQFKDPNVRFLIANEEHLKRMLQIKLDAIRSPYARIILSDLEKQVAKDVAQVYIRLSNMLGSDEYGKALKDLTFIEDGEAIGVEKSKDAESEDNLQETGLKIFQGKYPYNVAKENGDITDRVNEFLNFVRTEMFKVNSKAGKTVVSGVSLVYQEKGIEKVHFDGYGHYLETEADKLREQDAEKNGEKFIRQENLVEGKVAIGVKVDIRLDYMTNSDAIKDLRRDASLSTQLNMDDVFTSNSIFIPFEATFTRDDTQTYIPPMPYVILDEAAGFKLNANSPDVQFLAYCHSIATTLGLDDGETMNEQVARLKTSIDMDTLETIIYEDYDIGDVRIKNLSCGFGNVFTRMGVSGVDGHAPQYMGGQDTIIEVGLETTDLYSVGLINALPRLSTQYARDYRLILPASPLKIDSEITKLLGVNEVVIENVEIDTVPNQPGLFQISIRLISMDRTLRNREGLRKINEFAISGKATTEGEQEMKMQTYFDLNETLAQAEIYPDLELPELSELNKKGFVFIRHTFDTGRKYPDPDFYFVYGHVLQSAIFREAVENFHKEAMDEMKWVDSSGGEVSSKVYSEVGVKVESMNDKARKAADTKDLAEEVNQKMPEEKNLYKSEWDVINALRAAQVTDAWDISEDIKTIFLEPSYLSLIEYHEQINSAPSESKEAVDASAGAWVYDAMGPARDASKMINKYLTQNKPSDPADYTAANSSSAVAFGYYSFHKAGSKDDSDKKLDELLNDGTIQEILEKLQIKVDRNFKNALKDIIWAAACAATSEKEYAGKKSDPGWKPNVNFLGISISDSQDNSGKQVTNSLDDVVDFGIEFGAFRIKMHKADEIKRITGENVSKKIFKDAGSSSSINKSYFLLDPYYRKKGTSIKDVEAYKKNCVENLPFATEAFFRLLLFWIKRMIDDKILPNMSLDVLNGEFESELKEAKSDSKWFSEEREEIKRYLDFLNNSERAVDGGKVFAACVMALTNSDAIYGPMENRRYDMLNGMVEACMSVSGDYNPTDMDYIYLRKFLLALVGLGQIKKETEIGQSAENPITDFKKSLNEKKYIEAAEDPMTYIKHSFFDMVTTDMRGRMARAFPTFYVVFLDEGRKIGLWKLHDNFYNINSISEIQVAKSRKNPADTCRITMTNLFHTFTTEDDDDDTMTYEYDFRDVFTSLFNPRAYYLKEEAKRMKQQPLNRVKLTPGTRIHVRMGYGADASTLPVMFNGQIAEVTTGETVEVIAQGDGIELMNPILDSTEAHEKENQDKFYFNKWIQNLVSAASTPKSIIDAFLTSEGGWEKKFIRERTNGYYFNNHPLGITHFGDPRYDVVLKAGEPTQNIFEALSRPKWADLSPGITEEYSTDETPKLTMDVFGKTFWDVLHVCGSVSPDYIVGIAPFGFRSTIFHGHPRYYYAYEYYQENGVVFERRKPFQQYHIYTSFSDIIKNDIKSSSQDIKTNAMGLYREKLVGTRESQEKVGPLWVDWDIYPENQKSMVYDTQLYAKGVPVIGAAIPLVNWAYNRIADDKGVAQGGKAIAWRMTAHALKESVKDMYQGELIVMGDPSVKPHDRAYIYDAYENISGAALVEGCVQSFSAQTGFTTTLYPDCIATVDDRHELAVQTLGGGIASKGLMACIAIIAPSMIFGGSKTPLLSMAGSQARTLAYNAYKVAKSAGAANTARKIVKTAQTTKKVITAGKVAAGAGTAVVASGGSALIPLALLAVEMAVISTASGIVNRTFERWMASKQVLQVFPLKKNQKVMTSGLNGSAGLVYGSPSYDTPGTLGSLFTKLDTENNGFGPVINFMIDFLATDEMRRIAAKYERGEVMLEEEGSAPSTEKVTNSILEGIASDTSRASAGYRRLLLTPRLTPDSSSYENKITSLYNEMAFLDSNGIEIQPRITSETVYIKQDEKIKQALEMGIFQTTWDTAVPEGEYEFKEFNINGKPEQVRAVIIERNGKKMYDIPFLRQDAIDVLREIIIKASFLLPDPEPEKEKDPSDYIMIHSALKVGDDETFSSLGLSFILEAFGSRRKTLLYDAMESVEKEIKEMYKLGELTNEKLFEWKKDKNNKGEYTQMLITVYPPETK
ncbi:hypothetical protein P8918_13480 [Bacillus spizizenii]|nr:hypothetical protein [Bacillus spizizenii]MCY8890316.1 hypothetical protein [Bacillus spizizenii]MEC0842039.1 hypothetical protein [Bacillus spizizenii]